MITFNGVEGINEISVSNNQCKIFPNPSNGLVNVDFNQPLNKSVTIQVSDILGNIVYTKVANSASKDIQVDLSDKAKGMYIMRLLTDNSSTSQKIILQ